LFYYLIDPNKNVLTKNSICANRPSSIIQPGSLNLSKSLLDEKIMCT
jgi:hypothetical protein